MTHEVGNAVEVIPTSGYRGPLWHSARGQGIAASEIAAVVGLSRWDSRFNLWWHKRLGEGGWDGNAATNRGHRVEPLVMEDFEDAHPEFTVRRVGLLQNRDRPYQLATPDGIAYEVRPPVTGSDGWTGAVPVAAVEAKTAGGRQGWGEPGTDEVPMDYRCQVLWQMDTIGVEVAYVPVWFGFDFREYVVPYDKDDVEWLRGEAVAFLESLHGDPPPLDAHERTTQRLQSLHPNVVDDDVLVQPATVAQYLAAKRLRDLADERMTLAENRLRQQMGPFTRGVIPDPTARGGVRKAVGRSVYDVQASTIERGAFTVDRLNVSKPPTTKPRKVRAPKKEK